MKSVFISSTFKDMQAERDYLHEKVFPRLQREIAHFGETIQELDLRWGVDTSNMSEEESGKQVLKVCIDAIDRCKPYTVVLLGERYGWIPGISVVQEARDARVDAHYQEDMSITNLEIHYAALDDEEMLKRCIFCFRDPSFMEKMGKDERVLYEKESPMHGKQLEKLKEEIRNHSQARIIEYKVDWDDTLHQMTGMDRFGEQVYECLCDMVCEDLNTQEPRTIEQQTDLETSYLMEKYLSSYIPRITEEYEVLQHAYQYQMTARTIIFEKKHHDVFLCGEAGSGKSAFMAAMARRLMDNGERVLLYFAGAPGCDSIQMLKRMLIYKLEQCMGVPTGSTKGTLEERLEMLNTKLGRRQFFCFVDGIDQLLSPEDELYLDVLSCCPQVYFVLSAVSEFPMEKIMQKSSRSYQRVEIGGLDAFQVRSLINVTTGKRGKKLDDELIELIVSKKSAHNPLYLSLILQRFFMMDGREFQKAEALSPGMEGLHLYMEGLLAGMPEETENLVQQILTETGIKFGEQEFPKILALLAVSRNGFSEKELEEFLAMEEINFSQLRFQQIVSYLYDAFSVSQRGKWGFSHRLFKEAILQWPEKSGAQNLLVQYSLKNEAFLLKEGYRYILEARMPEGKSVLEKYDQFENTEELYDCVADLLRHGAEAYFSEMLEEEMSQELVNFWLFAFPGKKYGTFCRKLQNGFMKKILEKGKCTLTQQCAGWMRLAEEIVNGQSAAETAVYLEYAERVMSKLEEPEKTVFLAEALFYKAIIAEQENNQDEIWTCYETARKILGHEALYRESPIMEKAIFWRIRISRAWILEHFYSNRNYKTEELDSEIRFLEQMRSMISEESYAECRLRLIYVKILFIRNSKLTDEQKRTESAELLADAGRLVNGYPTIDNLLQMRYILTNVRYYTEEEKRFVVAKQAVGYSRRIFALDGTDENKETLMQAIFIYAEAADIVLSGGIKESIRNEIGKSSVAAWEEGFSLLEELEECGYMKRRVYDIAYYHQLYCDCREQLDFGESYYPVFLEHAGIVIELYENEKKRGLSERSLKNWLYLSRDAYRLKASIYQKTYENRKAVQYFQKALECAKELVTFVRNSRSVLTMLKIQEQLLSALYQARMDEEALTVADDLEQQMNDYQVIGGENSRVWIAYVRGRIAYERGNLTVARCECRIIEEHYEQLLTGKMLGDQCFLLKLDVALADRDVARGESAWEAAKKHLMECWKNNYMRQELPCMAAAVYKRLEYGYEKYKELRTLSGTPISEKEQAEWKKDMESMPIDRFTSRKTETEKAKKEKISEEEKERDVWRRKWLEKWENFSNVLETGTVEELLAYQEIYEKLLEADPIYTLPYELRVQRQKLAKTLYQKTLDDKYIVGYLEQVIRLAGETASGYTNFRGSRVRIYDLNPTLNYFERVKEWDDLAWRLLKSLYEETGDETWLFYSLSYLEHSLKRRNLSQLTWYEEVFSYLKKHLADRELQERLEMLRQTRYPKEFESLMREFRISRIDEP